MVAAREVASLFRKMNQTIARLAVRTGRAEVTRGTLQGGSHLVGGPVGMARPQECRQRGPLRSGGGRAAKGPFAPLRGERYRGHEVRLELLRVRSAGAVPDS